MVRVCSKWIYSGLIEKFYQTYSKFIVTISNILCYSSRAVDDPHVYMYTHVLFCSFADF